MKYFIEDDLAKAKSYKELYLLAERDLERAERYFEELAVKILDANKVKYDRVSSFFLEGNFLVVDVLFSMGSTLEEDYAGWFSIDLATGELSRDD